MEKGNKTNSAFQNKSNLFYRQNGRLALRTFLENLRENGNATAENKQITQCVFLGALCLKPVPDIFQVALQPYTFKTRTRTVLLNDAQTLNHRTEKPARKQSRKNTRRSTSSVQRNPSSSRILELFDNTHLPKLRLSSQTSGFSNKSALENASPIEKHVRNSRKMDVKSKQLPLLVPVKEIIDLETKNGDLQKLEPILIELDEDDIEDYLEVDQHVVADLEALIPEEEIEFISNSLIKPKQIPEISGSKIKEIKPDENGVAQIKLDDEPKVNEILETIAINEVVTESLGESVKTTTKSRKITEFLSPQVENNEIVVVDKGRDLTIEIPNEKKDYEIRTLRSGVKVSPPYSQSVRTKKSQIPKLIPVKNKETSKENDTVEEVQTEDNLKDLQNKNEETVIVEDEQKNEEIGEKLPIPTIVLDDNVKEEEPVEILVENKQAESVEITEEIEDKSKKNKSKETLNIFEKMMNQRKKATHKTKKQRKTKLNPKKRVKTRKIIEKVVEIENSNTKIQEKEEELTEVVPVKDDDSVKIIKDEVEKPMNEDKIEEINEDKVEEIINQEKETPNEEEPKEINVQDNNNRELKVGTKNRKIKRKHAEITKNAEIKKKTKKKKFQKQPEMRNVSTELNPESNDGNSENSSMDAEAPTNNNESIETATQQPKRINDEEKSKSSRKKRKTKDEDSSISSPESSSELSLENKDPDKETQLEPDDQMDYPSREPYRRIYRCRVCLLVFETYNKLKAHKTVHDVKNPYQCQECGKSYDDVEELAAHLRIHKGKIKREALA